MATTSVLWVAGSAYAAPPASAPAPPAAQPESRSSAARDKATEIVSQPARDVGASRSEIPPVLVKASNDPYSLAGLKTCRQIASAVQELNQVLGPDFQRGDKYQENRMAKLAQAGGKTVINSIIPFRGLVREVSGAAPADRRLAVAVDAGYARRGFLRGVHAARSCRTRF
jgi:hypothetical protein